MAAEIVIGLNVTDEERYTRYRAGMTPILTEHGGSFRYDFRVGEVLKAERNERINRLFVLSFPDSQTKERFFANPDYLAVRAEFFDTSVADIAMIAEYEV